MLTNYYKHLISACKECIFSKNQCVDCRNLNIVDNEKLSNNLCKDNSQIRGLIDNLKSEFKNRIQLIEGNFKIYYSQTSFIRPPVNPVFR